MLFPLLLWSVSAASAPSTQVLALNERTHHLRFVHLVPPSPGTPDTYLHLYVQALRAPTPVVVSVKSDDQTVVVGNAAALALVGEKKGAIEAARSAQDVFVPAAKGGTVELVVKVVELPTASISHAKTIVKALLGVLALPVPEVSRGSDLFDVLTADVDVSSKTVVPLRLGVGACRKGECDLAVPDEATPLLVSTGSLSAEGVRDLTLERDTLSVPVSGALLRFSYTPFADGLLDDGCVELLAGTRVGATALGGCAATRLTPDDRRRLHHIETLVRRFGEAPRDALAAAQLVADVDAVLKYSPWPPTARPLASLGRLQHELLDRHPSWALGELTPALPTYRHAQEVLASPDEADPCAGVAVLRETATALAPWARFSVFQPTAALATQRAHDRARACAALRLASVPAVMAFISAPEANPRVLRDVADLDGALAQVARVDDLVELSSRIALAREELLRLRAERLGLASLAGFRTTLLDSVKATLASARPFLSNPVIAALVEAIEFRAGRLALPTTAAELPAFVSEYAAAANDLGRTTRALTNVVSTEQHASASLPTPELR